MKTADRNGKKSKRGIIRKADVVLFCVLMLTAALLFARPFLIQARDGDTSSKEVTVRQDGKAAGTWPLDRDRVINLDTDGRHNRIVIEDGSVRMAESSCKNQVCVDEGRISSVGQSIICLPNRVVVEITGKSGNEDGGVDAVAR